MTAIPVGLNLASIGVDAGWWLDAARRTEDAGFDAAWIWDHFVSRGRLDDAVLEAWSTLAAAAPSVGRLRLGTLVTNVMNRHPAVLARIVATVADVSAARIELGIGIGGHPAEHQAYGIAFPPAKERAAHLEEAVAVLRHLFAGGPTDFEGRYYRLEGAHAFPVPDPPARISIAGQTASGARRAARLGDAWICPAEELEALRPAFEEGLGQAGREARDVPIIVTIEVGDLGPDLRELTERWRARGAGEIVVHDVRPDQLSGVLALGAR